jgi:hypothetical protein
VRGANGVPKRPRHPDKDIERYLLKEAESRGWYVGKKKKYFKIMCPCGDHLTWVHLSPSNPNYLKDRLSYLEGRTCWEREND